MLSLIGESLWGKGGIQEGSRKPLKIPIYKSMFPLGYDFWFKKLLILERFDFYNILYQAQSFFGSYTFYNAFGHCNVAWRKIIVNFG